MIKVSGTDGGEDPKCAGAIPAVEGVELRSHRTVLYNSIYLADDHVLVNMHLAVRWVPRADLGDYSMDRSMRLRIGHLLDGRAGPYLG